MPIHFSDTDNYKRLCGPEKFFGLSRNGPQDRFIRSPQEFTPLGLEVASTCVGSLH